jgi:hypothetical protein
MKSKSKEGVLSKQVTPPCIRITYQFDLERKTSRTLKGRGIKREKKRENQSTMLSRKLSRICVEKQRALHAYL